MDVHPELRFAESRVRALLETLERLAAGDTEATLEFSRLHDELDAIAFGIHVLADELRWAHTRIQAAERARTEELHEQALKRSDARFATAFHANPCAMTVVRLSDGCFQDINESFERHTGFHRDEVIGRTIRQIGLAIDPDDLAAISLEMRTSRRVAGREVRFRTRSGTPATAVYSAEIIMFGSDTCVLAAGVDVTDRRNNELQAAALQEELAHRGRLTMIEALTGSIAHEINQPLTAVMANAEAASRMMALASPPLAALREILDDILRDNQRAGDVVRRMRTLLEKRATVSEPVEVNGSVTEVVKLIQGNAATRRIALEVDLATRIEPVSADRIQFQQVVLNLVLNAFDAVQDVDASDRRVALRTSQRNRTATIEVRDQGTGLSDEAMARMFEPFFTTKRDGMGLGLWICRAIVSAHGGTLEASRNPLRGMTFSASFPLWNAGRRVARASRSGREVHVP